MKLLMTIRGFTFIMMCAMLLSAAGRERANGVQSASEATMKSSDFRWWHGLSDSAKENALQGTILGITGEWMDAYREARTDAENVLVAAKAKLSIPRTAATVVENGPYPPSPRFSKSLAFYRREIDGFYAKNRGSRKLSIFIILMCLSDIPTEPCAAIGRAGQNR